MLRQYIARNAFRRIVVTPDPDPDPEPDPDPDPNPPTGEVLDTRQFFDGIAPWSTPGQNDPADNWTIASAPTPSADTGPAGGSAADRVPTNGNSFIYTESSDTNESSWSLESPQLDASLGLCSITFDLFMRFGVGGVLTDGTLLVQGWNGSAWSQIGLAITGSQQTDIDNNWIESLTIDEYDSTGFSNDDFRFRFLFTRGAGDVFNYDCCIDRLVIFGPAGALIEDGGGDTVNRVGIFAQFRGEDAFGPIGGLFNTNFPEPEHSHSQVNITSPASRVFAGTQSRQIEIRPGDRQWDVDANTTSSPKRRAEYEWTPVRFNNQEDSFAGMAIYLPSDPMANIRGCAIFQLHYFPDPSQMVVASLFGGTLQIRNPAAPGGEATIRDIAIAPYLDKWTRIVVEFRSSRFSDGYVRVYLDDVQIANYTGANKSSGNGGPYWKNGLYFWGYDSFDTNLEALALFDNISLGDNTSNYESVNPANWS